MKRFFACWFVLGLTLAYGQTLKLDSLDKLAAKASDTVKVTLNGQTLRLAARFLSNDDPEEMQIKELVKNLKGIYVRSFEFSKAGQYADSDLDAIRTQLRDANWTSIVEVHSKNDDNADVFVKGDGDQFTGVAIIAAEPRELTVVHIDGPIDLEGVRKLSGTFGIPESIRRQIRKSR
jgi:hypothetical protein